MKKLLTAFLIITSLLATPCLADGISVTLAGEKLEFDVQPIMESDRVLVPLRKIFESLGAVVSWDDPTQTVIAVKDNTIITLQIDNTTAFVNEDAKTLDVPARLISDRTMVPIRFISEAMGCTVNWDDATQTVVIE